MKNNLPKLKTILEGIGITAIILTVIPYFSYDTWWIRMFDYPHLQLTLFTLIAFIIYFIKFDFKNWRDYSFVIILAVCFIFQLNKIKPYTFLADVEIKNSSSTNAKTNLSFYTANVLQKNDAYKKFSEEIKKYNSDILLLTETHRNWIKNIQNTVNSIYSFKQEFPLDNTYGMALYSKLPLVDTQVKFLVSDSIPSIHTKAILESNDTIQIFAIHPTPPMPQENPNSTDRDAEMMMIAKMALESKYPVVVIGDFNDVAWSVTSKLFQGISRLLDLRKGRGLYNTYNAKNVILRWPLDHAYVSSEFRLKHFERAEKIESDHYPLYFSLTFEPNLKHQQQLPYPSKKDLKSAQDQIDNYYKNLNDSN